MFGLVEMTVEPLEILKESRKETSKVVEMMVEPMEILKESRKEASKVVVGLEMD